MAAKKDDKKDDKKGSTENELITQVQDFARTELVGKLMVVCVSNLEKMKLPWAQTSESGQEIALNAMRLVIEKAVHEAVMVIAVNRKPALYATVEKVSFADKIQATLSLSKAMAGRHDLADAAGHTVAIVIASPEEMMGGAQKVKAQPDQKQLLAAKNDDQSGDYEIVPPANGFKFRVLKDKTPIPGAPKGFDTHEEAEKWLQEHLAIGKKKDEGDKKE